MIREDFWVVAKTRGVGVSLFFSNFLNFCRHSPIMFGIFPSFTVEISQKSMEHTEATKGTSLFVFRNSENFRLKLEFLRGIYANS